MLSVMVIRAAALLLLATSAVMAQVTPSVSTDPLRGSTFTTPFFSPSQTFTITSTFPSNLPATPTVITGSAGASPATGGYSFTYSIPLSSATMTPITSLLSSLASNGLPTQYTSALNPNPSGLDIVPDSASLPTQPILAVLFTAAMGAIAGALYL